MRRYFRLCVALVSLALAAPPAGAQLLKGTTSIIQNEALAGLVWVASGNDPCHYTEYWLLGPDYVYPNSAGAGQTIDTVLRPDPNFPTFSRPAEFFDYAGALLPGGKRILAPVYELENCGPNHDG